MDLFQRGFQERLERRNRETRHAPISTGIWRIWASHRVVYYRARYLVVEAAILSQTNKLLYHDYARFSRIDLSPNNSVPRARLPIKVETVVRNTHILVYKLYPLSYRFYTCTCIYTRVAYDLLVKQFPLRHM